MCEFISNQKHELPNGETLKVELPIYLKVCENIGIPVITNTELCSYVDGKAIYKHLDFRINANLFIVYEKINKNTFALETTYITT